jgi:phytoene desaturase
MERQNLSMTMTAEKHVLVVGGGIGGLTSACLLAASGYRVTLLEKNERLGGKLQPISMGDYQFDFGPSTITMPWIFKRIFEWCKQPFDAELSFVQLDINSRNHFSDGSIVELSANADRMEEQLRAFSTYDRQGFKQFLAETGKIQAIAEEQFFRRPFSHWNDFLSPALGAAMLRVHPFQSMDSFHRQYFHDPRLLMMMNRYATYVGSHPALTPATLSMIAYVELVKGVYYIPGGNYRLIEALERLAKRLGVQIIRNVEVNKIILKSQTITGVELLNGERIAADAIISNVDVNLTKKWLGQSPVVKNSDLSISGFLTLAGVAQHYPLLHHHNLFFPANYDQEFTDLFDRRIWPVDPTIYVCFSGASEPARAPNGSNLYILTNLPALSDQEFKEPSLVLERTESYREKILETLLEKKFGLGKLNQSLDFVRTFTPVDIMNNTGSTRGSLYGKVSHGAKSTFLRPSVKERAVQGLYYAGGTVHPGGGTPMVALSGAFAATALIRDHKVAPLFHL